MLSPAREFYLNKVNSISWVLIQKAFRIEVHDASEPGAKAPVSTSKGPVFKKSEFSQRCPSLLISMMMLWPV